MICQHFISHLCCKYFLGYIYFDCKFKSMESINCITCSVLLTFYFSPMLQIISEIYFDSRFKSSCKLIQQLACYGKEVTLVLVHIIFCWVFCGGMDTSLIPNEVGTVQILRAPTVSLFDSLVKTQFRVHQLFH